MQDPEVPSCLEEVMITYQQGQKSSKKSPYPKWLRRDNAVAALDATISECEEFLDKNKEGDDHDEVETFKEALEELKSEAEGVEFPAAFGG